MGLKSRIDEKYEGGVDALSKFVHGLVQLTDDDLWACSFMVYTDAVRFMEQLQQAGVESSQGPDPDLVLVNEFDSSVSANCDWLEIGRSERAVIVKRTGAAADPLIAPQGWTPEHGSGNYLGEDVEFLRMDGNVSVYFDRQKGCETYVRRSEPDPYEVYIEESRVIEQHLINPGAPVLTGEAVVTRIRQAITNLEWVLESFPQDWRIHYFNGKAKQAIGDLDGAYLSLKNAYLQQPNLETIPREFTGICLQLGRADEAVQAAQKAAALEPDNAHTLSNLACAYLIAGQIAEAVRSINAVLKLNSEDAISQRIGLIINEVIAGTRTQPQNPSQMMSIKGT